MALVVDLVDHTAVAGSKSRLPIGVADELDSRSDGHTGLDPGCKEACSKGIHMPVIGSDTSALDTRSWQD